jgi:cell division protease FtsH
MSSQIPSNKSFFDRFKKSKETSGTPKNVKVVPQTRAQKLLRGPLFWIIVAIIGVTIFGQISIPKSKHRKRLLQFHNLKLSLLYSSIRVRKFA